MSLPAAAVILLLIHKTVYGSMSKDEKYFLMDIMTIFDSITMC